MANLLTYILVALCVLYLPDDVTANMRRLRLSKKSMNLRKRQLEIKQHLFFKEFPEEVTIATKHKQQVLVCKVGGVPSPTIHWLKNGERIEQGAIHTTRDDSAVHEDHDQPGGQRFMRLGETTSTLYLDCPNHKTEGKYTCVAETPTKKRIRSTYVKVEKTEDSLFADTERCMSRRAHRVSPARVYMWTSLRMEFEGARVELYCRAEGRPAPSITWYGPTGQRIQEDDTFSIADNGDLVISGIEFFTHMGGYRCEASNSYGEDSVDMFLYPVKRAQEDFLPLPPV